ncbi:alpha hydrolase-13 [Acrodontium crateriforme]|uniref:Alpha hydrolase-13 n=1 Tax=Acrodontium crateriforme TaxID=150365 RepID=A0AAQ3R4U0_9PEZI|nr:alpha hydrolase-13 [Acrodontium crateriforme]
MESFQTNDGATIKYIDVGLTTPDDARPKKGTVIMIHGFTGSSEVWKRNVPALASEYNLIIPDLRGHGSSSKPKHGYHVSRLAMDLHELILHLRARHGDKIMPLSAIGGSLGCSILWCFSELFGTSPFQHMIFIDQSPLQNSTLDGWDSRFCNRGMNSAPAVAALQTTLAFSPVTAHRGTIAACLAYRSHPLPTDDVSTATAQEDEAFFLGEAMKGDSAWYGKLMADHTALDWRDSIRATLGPASGSETKVLVVASSRSGCFPSEGPMKVVDLVNGGEKLGKAKGLVVNWGGHWCYWEKPELFNQIVLDFLKSS